jgi:tmRNA-binding protein
MNLVKSIRKENKEIKDPFAEYVSKESCLINFDFRNMSTYIYNCSPKVAAIYRTEMKKDKNGPLS